MKDKKLLTRIKNTVIALEPTAQVYLYGSYARGESNKYSDIDLLILLEQDVVSEKERQRIAYPLYDIEFEVGKIISPMVRSINEWETKYWVTPLYENIKREGILL
jgi:uncharacterized protein